jgi:hypothetical protein
MIFVPCIKAGEMAQTSFLSFFNVKTKWEPLLPCDDVEIKQIGSKSSLDQTTYPPVFFLEFWVPETWQATLFHLWVMGVWVVLLLQQKWTKTPVSLCTMEHSHPDGSAHLACSNSSTTSPAPSSNSRILPAATVLPQLAQLGDVR